MHFSSKRHSIKNRFALTYHLVMCKHKHSRKFTLEKVTFKDRMNQGIKRALRSPRRRTQKFFNLFLTTILKFSRGKKFRTQQITVWLGLNGNGQNGQTIRWRNGQREDRGKIDKSRNGHFHVNRRGQTDRHEDKISCFGNQWIFMAFFSSSSSTSYLYYDTPIIGSSSVSRK